MAVIRETHVGVRGAGPVLSGGVMRDGVGFLVTIPVPWSGGRSPGDLNPRELVAKLVATFGAAAASQLRMVIGVNRVNDIEADVSTAQVEAELRVEVEEWERQVNEDLEAGGCPGSR